MNKYLFALIVVLVFFLGNEIWANKRLEEFNKVMTDSANDYYTEMQKDKKLLEACKKGE